VDKARLEEAIERINIILDAETALFKIGYKVDSVVQNGTNIKAFCPIHHDSMIRSLQLDPNKRRFRCSYYNCKGNKGGTFFELFCLAKEVSEAEGVRMLCEELGLELDLPTHLEEPARETVLEAEQPPAMPEVLAQALDESDLPIEQDFTTDGLDSILDDRAETESPPSASESPVALEAEPEKLPAEQGYSELLAAGTEAFEWVKQNGFLTTEDYSEWLTEEGTHNCVVSRPGLTRDDLVEFCNNARRRYYLRPSYMVSKMKQVITHPTERKRVLKASRTFFKYLVKKV